MATDVPTTTSLKSSATDGAVPGGALALGETLGRGTFGAGVGTALGGIVAASTQSSEDRRVMSIMAVERGMNELLVGGGGGRNTRRDQGVK